MEDGLSEGMSYDDSINDISSSNNSVRKLPYKFQTRN